MHVCASAIAGFTCCSGEKVGTWARTASTACIARKTWDCAASVRGGMYRRCSREQKRPPGRANEVWGMDFVADQLADGRKLRTLTIIDLFTRECLAIEVGFSLRAEHVVAAVNRLEHSRGLPERISCDNGSEFSGGQMDLWAYNHKVQMDFNRRGKPTDNATVESFNGKFREECLNAHWFD
jgi:putative transposase